MSKNIFITEDDESIRALIKVALEGYNHNVYDFETAEDAMEKMKTVKPDLAIFDLMLPGMQGTEAVKRLRESDKFKKLPIIILTAKDNEIDKIIGLDSGADDYITKPFSVMELMARVRSQLRRTEEDSVNYKEMGALKINTDTREVFVNDSLVILTFKEYELLVYLINNTHRVVTRDELLNKIWGYEYTGETRTIDIHIRTLRQKIGTAGEYIKTIRGMGYRISKD
ncbi:MAG: response regulator transcription factor [Clostridia bacterium]|nr:response regulator transcription factor [Clostridia bacterium]